MYLLGFADLVYIHVDKKVAEQMTVDQRRVFEHLVVGVNVFELTDYDRVARAVSKIPKTRIRTITRPQVIAEFLCGEDFHDESGYLM